jgi:HEAT repeat protein
MAAQSLGGLGYQLRDHQPSAPAASDRLTLKRRIDVATRGLVPLLSDRDPRVRAAAAIGLGTMARGPSPGPPAPEQVAALRNESNAVRRQAARMIYGSPAMTLLPELVAALEDESAEVRTAAAQALARFGPDLDPQIPALTAMMQRDEKNVRKACAEALKAAWPTPALVPTLSGFLRSRDRDVRFYAAQLLGRVGPEARAAVPALIAVLNEPLDAMYPDPGRAAALALGQMGPSREAIAALVEVISPEKVEPLLDSFVHDLSDMGPRDVDGRVFVAVDVQVRLVETLRIMAAIEGLGDIGPPAVAAVPAMIAVYRKALETRHSMAQPTIPEALGRIAPNSAVAPDAVAALIRVLDSKNYPFHLGAVEALGHFGTDASAAIPRLRALQQSPDQSVHNAAAKSLAAIEAQSRRDAGGKR